MYLCIDLKSFYASVECVERGLDPVTTDLVVADPERTDKTIGLAVSPDIYAVYLKYIAKEDIHVYSIDEAFMDVTDYLSLYQMTVPV